MIDGLGVSNTVLIKFANKEVVYVLERKDIVGIFASYWLLLISMGRYAVIQSGLVLARTADIGIRSEVSTAKDKATEQMQS